MRWLPALLALLGCNRAADPVETGSLPTSGNCDYPTGAVEPMALGEVLSPYRWANALHLDGRSASLQLAEAPCATDDDIDWSPFDVLLFVSIPAW